MKKKISNNEINTSHYLGWNSLVITKYEILENKILDDKMIDVSYPDLKNKQKIFVIVKGALEFKTDNKKNVLKVFDAFDMCSKNQKYEILEKKFRFFIVSAKNLESQEGSNFFFNFKRSKKRICGVVNVYREFMMAKG